VSRKTKHFPSQTIWQRKTPVMSCIYSSSVASCKHWHSIVSLNYINFRISPTGKLHNSKSSVFKTRPLSCQKKENRPLSSPMRLLDRIWYRTGNDVRQPFKTQIRPVYLYGDHNQCYDLLNHRSSFKTWIDD
jgi:hypothetical protein